MRSSNGSGMISSGGDSTGTTSMVLSLLISETGGLIAGAQQPLTRKASATATLLVIEQELNID